MIETDPTTEDEDPDGHKAHALLPVLFEYAPAEHKTHALSLLAPATPEYVPATQFTHTADEFAATTTEYAPAGQETQAFEPVTVLYLPAAHAEHRPPLGPVYPVLHAQSVCDPLPGPVNELAGHKLQLGLPSGDHFPSGHDKHVSLPVAPKFTEYKPSEQLEHAVRPSWLLNVPRPQIRQVYAPAPAACAYPLLQ